MPQDTRLPPTTTMAAKAFGVSRATVGRMIERGELPAARKSGGWHIVEREEVEKLAAARKTA